MNLERYSRYCGPAALAYVKGITKLEAAEILYDLEKSAGTKRVRGTTGNRVLAQALGTKYLAARGPLANLTLNQFLKTDVGRGYLVVVAGDHFHVCRDGEIVEANGVEKRRARVRGYIPARPPIQRDDDLAKEVNETLTITDSGAHTKLLVSPMVYRAIRNRALSPLESTDAVLARILGLGT